MNFFKAFYITGFTSIVVTIIAFGNNVVVTRFLGTSGRGQYSIIANIILITGLILGEGIRRSNIIMIGRNHSILSNLIKKIIIIITAYILIIITFVNLNPFPIDKWLKVNIDIIYIGLFATVFVILWRSLQALFLGLEDYKKFNFMQLLYTFLILIFNLFVIYLIKASLREIIFSFVFAAIVVSLYEYYNLNKISRIKKNILGSNSNKESLILRATFVSIGGFILLKGDIFVVNYLLNSSVTGIYSISLVITDLFQKLPLVLGPIVIARSVNNDVKKEILNISRMSRVLVIINILLVLFFLVFGKWIITFLFTSEFAMSFNLLLYILPSLIVFSSGHIINAFFMGQGFPNFVIINNFSFAILNILLNFILIPQYGIEIAAINCSISYFLWSMVFLIYFKRKYNFTFRDLLVIKKEDFRLIKTGVLA